MDKIKRVEEDLQRDRNQMKQLAQQIQANVQELDSLNSQFVSSTFLSSRTPLLSSSQYSNENIHDISDIDDRMVIPVKIKVPGYKEYTLDAQIDIGAMSSYCKFKTIPAYYWKPTQVQFRVVNKPLIKIPYISLDFPILLGSQEVYVTLYNYDNDADMLLG